MYNCIFIRCINRKIKAPFGRWHHNNPISFEHPRMISHSHATTKCATILSAILLRFSRLLTLYNKFALIYHLEMCYPALNIFKWLSFYQDSHFIFHQFYGLFLNSKRIKVHRFHIWKGKMKFFIVSSRICFSFSKYLSKLKASFDAHFIYF